MKASELRLKARESLTGNYWPALLAALIASFFGATVSGSTGGGVDLSFDLNADYAIEIVQMIPPGILAALILLLSVSALVGLISFIIGGVIQLGYCSYLLKQHDREISSVNELFSHFNSFGRGFLQLFLRSLFVALWSLLLVIPGIIKSYSYAMTPFIMAENPELTALQAITESKLRMRGHKWELFCLSLSFFGWILLCVLTCGIGFIFLRPYMEAAYAAFYRDKIAPQHTSAAYVVTDKYIEL